MWIRLCIDQDVHGNVRGISAEVHGPDGPTTIYVDPCGPFDDVPAAVGMALQWCRSYIGEQLQLF
jgi:hypothetical protein